MTDSIRYGTLLRFCYLLVVIPVVDLLFPIYPLIDSRYTLLIDVCYVLPILFGNSRFVDTLFYHLILFTIVRTLFIVTGIAVDYPYLLTGVVTTLRLRSFDLSGGDFDYALYAFVATVVRFYTVYVSLFFIYDFYVTFIALFVTFYVYRLPYGCVPARLLRTSLRLPHILTTLRYFVPHTFYVFVCVRFTLAHRYTIPQFGYTLRSVTFLVVIPHFTLISLHLFYTFYVDLRSPLYVRYIHGHSHSMRCYSTMGI